MEQSPPRGGSEDHSDTSEQSSSTNDRSSNGTNAPSPTSSNQPRRRGSRGGQGRPKSAAGGSSSVTKNPEELPEPMREGRLGSPEAREEALVKKPQIGDTMPVPNVPPPGPANGPSEEEESSRSPNRSGQKRRRKSGGQKGQQQKKQDSDSANGKDASSGSSSKGRSSSRRRRRGGELSAEARDQRRGRERNGKPIGRYFMCVQVREGITQVAVLEGRNLIEHYVSRPADDVSQIHGNIYLGRVQNVLPGMEAAFVDIATPKNAVLYRGDVQYDSEDIESDGNDPRIEQILKNRQTILCQVTKNPIGAKGARLTQEVSLPGRFVVLIPNSTTYGISKRLPDQVRRRLRSILDKVKPEGHGLIVRTAAEHATEAELTADMRMLLEQWDRIEAQAKGLKKPALLHREPELAVRVIREEFNADYRGVVIDDRRLFEEVREYVAAFNPELADRVEYYDAEAEGLALFERHHVHEQVHKALDRKVWLPSGGSLIIEHTEALSVIDVNTGKNVGTSNLEETVFSNNLEAAEEIAKQLRLRDIGGIIVIDFIDMEVKANRAKVIETFRDALARDKTRTQVFDISELGLVEMTRKRIGEGLLTEFSEQCPDCTGRGVVVDHSLLD